MKKYIAYCTEYGQLDEFDTFEEAKEWLNKAWEDMRDDGYPESTMNGGDYIAEVTHRSEFVETDNKSNYCQIDCSECKKEECDGEEWPYDSEFEKVGYIGLKRVINCENIRAK